MISVFIFFDKTYLQKPHCVTIENISSNKKNQFKINSFVSVKINSGQAIENFGWAISAHAALY